MNDVERLETVIERLRQFEGLGEHRFDRLISELERSEPMAGRDDQGRVKVTMFDAKAYDVTAFHRCNDGRFVIHPIHAALNRETLGAAAGSKIVCVFVNDYCDKDVVRGLSSLGVELIALRCAGFNNVDLKACEAEGISVVRVPAYSPYAVAEFTVALMLILNRHLHQAYIRNRAGSFVLDGLTGFDMRGKTVGVVGTGKIGLALIEILLGFGCNIKCYDKFPDSGLASRAGVEYVGLPDLFSVSDIISLHVPLFDETHYLIDREAIARMKEGVMLINTSRGGLVDTRALIDGLKSGKIGSAGLDVYEEEAGIFFHDLSDQVLTDDILARLMTFNNVVVTSHQAYLTEQALENIAETTLSNVGEYLDGRRGRDLSNAVMA